ncbi:MAG: NAD(P)/FAD-dependent oxidoreductase [Akkermansiaceae bacterium]
MEYDKDRVLVIGGGVIGFCSAYHLLRAGRAVTIIDSPTSEHTSCSYGNAGMVVPSHFIPLAAPGMVSKGLKMLANPEGPFYIRPRINMELTRWCKLFMKHCTTKHTMDSRALLRDMNLESRKLFLEMAGDTGSKVIERGLLSLCVSDKALHEEAEVAAMANEIGISAELCGPERLAELDPDIEMTVRGGIWFKQDCHMDPTDFMKGLRREVLGMGAEVISDTKITALKKGSNATVTLKGISTPPDLQIVLACGAWSSELMKSLGLRMPMQAGKGYSLSLKEPRQQPRLCSILAEAKVAVTPMNEQLRFAGTMEICGNDLSINQRRVNGIIKSVEQYFPAYDPSAFTAAKPWAGLRPCSPDGLPYIGRVAGYSNLTVASGHSMMGLSLGPVTGKLVSSILTGSETPDIRRLDPLRFG